MKTTTILANAALAAAFLTTGMGVAHAATPLTFDADGFTSITGGAQVKGGSFDDFFTFTLTSASDLDANALSSLLKGKDTVVFSSIELFSGNVGSGSLVASGTVSGSTALFSTAGLAANKYYLEVKGSSVSSTIKGAYSGNVTVTPVPEPESYAMLLAGLGLMGTIARRRSKDKAN